jgi:hypothetical protein
MRCYCKLTVISYLLGASWNTSYFNCCWFELVILVAMPLPDERGMCFRVMIDVQTNSSLQIFV